MTRPVAKQCKSCPWKVDVVPSRDIPNGYCPRKHRDLDKTIARDTGFDRSLNMMACHKSPTGAETVCVGWADNQLGVGNNIGLRLKAIHDPNFPRLELDGEQHARFEDTIPDDDDDEDLDDDD